MKTHKVQHATDDLTAPSINHHGESRVMQTRRLTVEDVDAMWVINEQGLPGTGQVSREELTGLLDRSNLALGCFRSEDLLGFVLCLPPGTDYGSLNYAWFNQRYESFVYVDRVAVAIAHQNHGVGSSLYERVISHAQEHEVPVVAEVNLMPPNPGSMRFHERFAFDVVGVLHHDSKSVTMLLRG